MLSVYVETTIPSYLVSRPSKDIIIRSRQELTRLWWDLARPQYRLLIADPVLDEVSRGDADMARERRALLAGIELLQVNDAVVELHQYYLSALGLPEGAQIDALHLALASHYEVDYLLTWNLKHIANGHIVRRLNVLNEGLRITSPVIVTPDELMEPADGGGS